MRECGVCMRWCSGVYLTGDLEVLWAEDREALRELQQLPWRCELLLGLSPGDLMNTEHTHTHTEPHNSQLSSKS